MRISPQTYAAVLQRCEPKLRGRNGSAGTENIVRDALAAALKGSATEVSLASVGGTPPDSAARARIDIVDDAHGIELKVIRLPRVKDCSPSRCLYDLGQLANDYLKLASARNLASGELVVLLHGPLVAEYDRTSLLREFHNRMFVDYTTARQLGELRPEVIAQEPVWKQRMRKLQLRVIRRLGLDAPFGVTAGFANVVKKGDLALVGIPVARL